MKHVDIYTDGSCISNPGPGGWAAVLICGDREKEICGGEKLTTNNRMEITAVIEALKALKYPCEVRVVSDSRYVVDAFNEGWIGAWEKNNWERKKKPVPNADLWKTLLGLARVHKAKFEWTRGHAGNEYNERCDLAAQAAAESYKNRIRNPNDADN